MKKTRTIFIPLILLAALLFAGCAQASEKTDTTGLLTLNQNENIRILEGDRFWTLGAGRTDGTRNNPPDTGQVIPASFGIRDLWTQRDRIFIDGRGKIGIGTTAPEVKLDIKEPDQTYPPLRITNTKNDGYAGLIFGTGSGIQGHMGYAGSGAANQTIRGSVYFGSAVDLLPTRIVAGTTLNPSISLRKVPTNSVYGQIQQVDWGFVDIQGTDITIGTPNAFNNAGNKNANIKINDNASASIPPVISLATRSNETPRGEFANMYLAGGKVQIAVFNDGDSATLSLSENDLNLIGNLRIKSATTGLKPSSTNKIVCVTAAGLLGVCSNAPQADGTCNCQ